MTTSADRHPEPWAAAAGDDDARQQVRTAIDRLFVRRGCIALGALIGGMALFTVADLWQHHAVEPQLLGLRALSVTLAGCAYWLLRQERLRPYAVVINWLVFTIGCTLMAVGGIGSAVASSATPILNVLLTFAAAALFPWGALAQLSAAVVAGATIGANIYWVHVAGRSMISSQAAESVVVCLACSVICAFTARARLLALLQDTVERQRAEHTLRLSNQHLEGRVRERVAELEAAKSTLARQMTENREVAQTLHESENLLRAVIDNSSALIYVTNLEGRYILTNAQHARVLGSSCSAIIGKTIHDLVPPAVAASVAANDRRVLTTNRPIQFEEVIPQADGEHTYLSIRFPVRAPSGATYGICDISTDITERKRMESALRHSQSTLTTLIETSDEGIWALDRDYRIQLLNSVARQRFPQAYNSHPAIGGDFRELLPPDARLDWGARFAEALGGQRVAAETAITLNGELQQFLVSLNPIVEGTQVMGVTIFIKDISALKRAEEDIRQHQAELAHVLRRSTMGEMAAELAHEINQPLGAITNYAQGCRHRLQSGNVDRGELGHAINQIASEAHRAGGILERWQRTVLQEPSRHDRLDINRLVHDAVRAVEFRCGGLAMQLALTPELPRGYGDAIQIEQVVLNLLHNAIDALQALPTAARRLTVETRLAEARAIEVAVHDTGQGLDPAVAEKIFQPFVTTKSDGLGMGLAISRSIVEAHGGRLWVTANPERGCTFHFTLPTASPL